MIKELTSFQEEMLQKYREEYIEIGLNTDRVSINKKKIKGDIENIYVELLGRKKPKAILVFENPVQCWYAVNIFSNQVRAQVETQVWDQVLNQVLNQVKHQVRVQVRDQVLNQVGDQVLDQVWGQVSNQVLNQVRDQVGVQVSAQVWNQVGDQVRDQVGVQVSAQVWNRVRAQVSNQVGGQVENQVWGQVRAQVGGQVWDQVLNQVRAKVSTEKNLIEYVSPYFQGSFDSFIFSFYDFFIKETNVKLKEEIEKKYEIWKKSLNYGLIFPLENVCIISQKPTKIFKNDKGLHKDLQPALEYDGGFKIYALNGVIIPEKYVLAKEEEIDSNEVLKIKNAEIRKEVIKKIGMKRLVNDLNVKIIEKNEQYELLNFDIIEGKYRPYLKMINPSTRDVHVEGVHPSCSTIDEALAWRNGLEKYKKPLVLT